MLYDVMEHVRSSDRTIGRFGVACDLNVCRLTIGYTKLCVGSR